MSNVFDRLTARFEPAAAAPEPAADAPPPPPSRQIKDAVLELLKYGLLEQSRKPNLYRVALANAAAVAAVLAPLDLEMRIDDTRGLLFVAVLAEAAAGADEEWSHPLVRRQRLNLEQSLLVAILRQFFVNYELEAGKGSEALVAIEDLLPHLQLYFGDSGSEALEKKRLLALLEQLKTHGIVSDMDEHERIIVRPIIAHLANPENLQNLLQAVRAEAGADGDAATVHEE